MDTPQNTTPTVETPKKQYKTRVRRAESEFKEKLEELPTQTDKAEVLESAIDQIEAKTADDDSSLVAVTPNPFRAKKLNSEDA